MARRWGLITALLLLVPAVLACTQGTAATRDITDDDLRTMVLKAEDLPAGFSLAEEKLTNNEQLAQEYTDPETVRGLVDEWGRRSGIESVFDGTGVPDKPRLPLIIGSSVDRFVDAAHARSAWRKDELLLPYTKASRPTAPTRLADPHLGDQSAATRMYMTDSEGRELVMYAITFRQGAVVADVATASLKHKDDRGEHAARLARLVHERVSTRFKGRRN